MSEPRVRSAVRLGTHDGKSIYHTVEGLHEPQAGVIVVGDLSAEDPEVIFEEHGTDTVCRYFEIEPPTALLDETIPGGEARADMRERLGSEDPRIAWTAMRAAFLSEEPALVNHVLRELREAYEGEGGAGTLISVSPRFQRRLAVIRMLHTARAQPERPFLEIVGGPYPLQHHASGVDMLPGYLYLPIVLLASPFTRGFVANRPILGISRTVLLVVLVGRAKGIAMKDDDVTWKQVYEGLLPELRENDGQGTTWLRKTNHHAADLDGPQLIRWWTGQLNELFTEATDLGRYSGRGGQFDAGNAYRELRTLDRIISDCVRIQTHPSDHAVRVGLAFEFFDLLPNILDRAVRAEHLWGTLANPRAARKILDRAFSLAPESIAKVLKRRTREVLSVLRAETLEHVMPGRREQGKVRLGGGSPKIVQEDVYVAQLLHQLRNTHHGYELESAGQRDILNNHTGHISQAFPELVVLYVIALMSDPASALAGGWF